MFLDFPPKSYSKSRPKHGLSPLSRGRLVFVVSHVPAAKYTLVGMYLTDYIYLNLLRASKLDFKEPRITNCAAPNSPPLHLYKLRFLLLSSRRKKLTNIKT